MKGPKAKAHNPVMLHGAIKKDSGLMKKKFNAIGLEALFTVITADNNPAKEVLEALMSLRYRWVEHGYDDIRYPNDMFGHLKRSELNKTGRRNLNKVYNSEEILYDN